MQRRTDSDHEWRWLLRARDFKQLESSSAGLLRAFASAARSTDPVAAAAALATAALAAAALAAALAAAAFAAALAATALSATDAAALAAAEPAAASAATLAPATLTAAAVAATTNGLHRRLHVFFQWRLPGWWDKLADRFVWRCCRL